MKKLTIIALALCLAVVMAAPVMAVDADFSGAYRVRGAYTEHYDLDKDSANNAFMNMRFRLQTVFKASDNLSVTVRFDALEKDWGASDSPTPTSTNVDDNIDFDRAYMTIKSDFGKFDIGRQKGGTFGTTFVDSEADVDRIKYTKVMDGLTLMAIFEKVGENDNALTDDGNTDDDKYCLAAIHKMENITAGVLGTFYNYKSLSDDATTSDRATVKKYALTPYAVAKFGPLAIQGELCYVWGEKDWDQAGRADIDYKTLAYNIEATYNLGQASIMAGYAFASGEDTGNDDTGANGVGNDWEKLFILTTNEVPALVNLGGYGNLSKDGVDVTPADDLGSKIIYGGANYSPLDNLNLGLVVGYAEADEPTAGNSDEYGTEYDLTLNWKIYDNLSYTAIAAFLSAGDLYKDEKSIGADFEDTYALFHQLQLSF